MIGQTSVEVGHETPFENEGEFEAEASHDSEATRWPMGAGSAPSHWGRLRGGYWSPSLRLARVAPDPNGHSDGVAAAAGWQADKSAAQQAVGPTGSESVAIPTTVAGGVGSVTGITAGGGMLYASSLNHRIYQVEMEEQIVSQPDGNPAPRIDRRTITYLIEAGENRVYSAQWLEPDDAARSDDEGAPRYAVRVDFERWRRVGGCCGLESYRVGRAASSSG